MLNKREKIQGSFIYRNNPQELARRQVKRVIYSTLAFVLYAIPPLFIPQAVNAYLEGLGQFAIIQTYVIFTVLTGILLLYCCICSFSRYKLRAQILAKNAPPSGFENTTWLCYTLAPFCAVLTSLAKIVGIFFAFSIWSLVLIFISAGASVFAYLLYRETKLAYAGDAMTFLDEKETKKYAVNPDAYFSSETKSEDENEDFYND